MTEKGPDLYSYIYSYMIYSLCIVKKVTLCSIGYGLLASPWWDSVRESKLQNHEKSWLMFDV